MYDAIDTSRKLIKKKKIDNIILKASISPNTWATNY